MASFWLHFMINFTLTLLICWYQYYWVEAVVPQHRYLWSVMLATVAGLIGHGLGLLVAPSAGICLLLLQRRWRFLPLFINASLLSYLFIRQANLVAYEVSRLLLGDSLAHQLSTILLRLVIEALLFIGLAWWLRQTPLLNTRLQSLSADQREEWVITTLIVTLALLFMMLATALRHFHFSVGTVALIQFGQLCLLLAVSVSLLSFTRRYLNHQRTSRLYQAARVRTAYDEDVSAQLSDIRQFKRSYQDLMLQVGQYLDRLDYEGLSQFYESLLAQWNETNQRVAIVGDDLDHVLDARLKGLIFQKMMTAQNQGVRLQLEVPDPVGAFPVNSVDLLRMVGILIDNAVEAVTGQAQAMVTVAVLRYPHSLELTVANPVDATTAPQLSQMLQRGYSTKGDQRGLGLATVQSLMDALPGAGLQLQVRRGQLLVTLLFPRNEVTADD